MPQLSKGGKWVFGWCVVNAAGEIQIPPAAYAEYGFEPGGAIACLRSSRRSGGFSAGRLEKLTGAASLLLRRSLGPGVILDGGRIVIPPGTNIQPGECLLAVRGSGYALSFLRYGPICEEAVNHPEIEEFTACQN